MPMDCFPRDLVPVINILAQISLPWHRKTDDLSRRLFLSHLGWSHRNDFSEGHGREVLFFSRLLPAMGGGPGWVRPSGDGWGSPDADSPLCCPQVRGSLTAAHWKPRSLPLLADSGEHGTMGNKTNT